MDGVSANTIVVVFGDHGWQLGEHGLWDKHTNFDITTSAPVMFRVPGLTDRGGVVTHMPTETVDIFPSLVDFASNGANSLPACPRWFSPVPGVIEPRRVPCVRAAELRRRSEQVPVRYEIPKLRPPL